MGQILRSTERILVENVLQWSLSGLSIVALAPNLKFVALAIMEILAFSTQNLWYHVTLITVPLTLV